MDDAGNESGSEPLSADIVIVPAAKVTAGFRGLLNADGVLTPRGNDADCLEAKCNGAWR